ncbi:MAG: site-specific integrase [Thermodesulfobacteriota bacterium]
MAKIRKRGNTYQIDYFDPTGKRIRKSFKKRKDAEAELGKRVSLIAEKRYLDVKKEYLTTLRDLIAKYKENFEHQSSYQTGKQHYLENFKTYFGEDSLLSNIRYVELETYRNHLRQKITKNKTVRTDASVNREMSCLHHIFSKAVEWDMIEQNPFDKGKSLILKENNQRLRFLTEDEIIKLLDACPDYLRDIVECALNTGMRRQEVLGLKWSQVRNGFIYLKKTKTNESRQVPVNDTLESLFKQIRKQHGFKSEHVFLYDGQTIEAKTGKTRNPKEGREAKPITEIKRAFNAAVTRAGIEGFTFHDLRHTFASQVIMKGGSLKDVQELLGHKTMTMTLRYAHLTQEHKKKAVNLLNGLTACHKTVTIPGQVKSVSM